MYNHCQSLRQQQQLKLMTTIGTGSVVVDNRTNEIVTTTATSTTYNIAVRRLSNHPNGRGAITNL